MCGFPLGKGPPNCARNTPLASDSCWYYIARHLTQEESPTRPLRSQIDTLALRVRGLFHVGSVRIAMHFPSTERVGTG